MEANLNADGVNIVVILDRYLPHVNVLLYLRAANHVFLVTLSRFFWLPFGTILGSPRTIEK